MPERYMELAMALEAARRLYHHISDLQLLATKGSVEETRLQSCAERLSEVIGELSVLRSRVEAARNDK